MILFVRIMKISILVCSLFWHINKNSKSKNLKNRFLNNHIEINSSRELKLPIHQSKIHTNKYTQQLSRFTKKQLCLHLVGLVGHSKMTTMIIRPKSATIRMKSIRRIKKTCQPTFISRIKSRMGSKESQIMSPRHINS